MAYFACNLQTAWKLAFIGTISNHGVGFSRSSLTISKQRAIVPTPCIFQYTFTKVSKNFFLKGMRNVNIETSQKLIIRKTKPTSVHKIVHVQQHISGKWLVHWYHGYWVESHWVRRVASSMQVLVYESQGAVTWGGRHCDTATLHKKQLVPYFNRVLIDSNLVSLLWVYGCLSKTGRST